MVQTPPPPSISPRQMTLLRIVAAMAWSDGGLATEEVDIMLDRFSGMFAADAPQQQQLRQELQDYVMQNIPLEELTPKLQSEAEKHLVLRLGYEVIRASARVPGESTINEQEAAAYRRLVELLEVNPEQAAQIENEGATGSSGETLVDSLTRQLEQFMN